MWLIYVFTRINWVSKELQLYVGKYLYLLESGYVWLPMVLLTEIVQTFILADFCYYSVKRASFSKLCVPSNVCCNSGRSKKCIILQTPMVEKVITKAAAYYYNGLMLHKTICRTSIHSQGKN
ncbi:uncharacterized protein LOC141671037 isoform X2 [Apium graveolens]|uniref:uncharacterized protein LOC141671037 isoform X2 n=1 Tax=Apium graveolens TaxID=4045 RepID=UPI003D7BDCE8